MNLDTTAAWRRQLQIAQAHAQAARFDASLATCREIIASHVDDVDALLSIGAFLLSFGFLTEARHCFLLARQLAPNDMRPLVNLANVAQQAGAHGESRQLYAALLAHFPDHPVLRRNALLCLEYDPEVTDNERFVQAKAWGAWAIAKAGGMRARPAMQPIEGRALRVGYVSADLCQHTVGLFVKDIVAAHDPALVVAFAYSAGQVNDWVSAELRQTCVLREVAALDDAALAEQIRGDAIDVLVDLSGHTAGSRLTVFAHRPAPLQVSWLGYFATTGLPLVDAVLLDEWHAPPGIESQFVESIVRLPRGRFCYTPVPFAPTEVAPPPCVTRGHVTFGSFNNTAKLNADVLALWARILVVVPHSRLVLKWRTFQDAELCASVRQFFSKAGVEPGRVELRGASFHADLLKEYADIDIALDPFPFTGGLTSCEALWMGVPVVTWPQSRVVSRQTYAFLCALGLSELAARDEDSYVGIAKTLAADVPRLRTLRAGMRERMRASSLCDAKAFTRDLEDVIWDLARVIAAED